ncbi:hypothetical protein GOODEAATRI_001646, partial [Goodea atripinnis]
MSPPCSPDLTLDRGFRDLKENKEPSPKVKRRRSVKISSVALEPTQWQNDALQILSSINDYRSMNDFLIKKMDDGKSIRYKDLYALFEQILEKTMRQEQRDWRESPVKFDPELSSRQFRVDVSRLTNDERTVPLVVEKLINYIEMHGLYTEGIYRKSGSTNKIKELKLALDTDVENMNLDDYSIHVIASVFKQWLRDLPNPLMTFELYEEFIRAMSKISLQEETNRMSANALAIVFAPCILRCPDTTDPLQSVKDISKTTACVELIICEQMTKYKVRLKDINTLEFAENKAKSKLSLIRRSM